LILDQHPVSTTCFAADSLTFAPQRETVPVENLRMKSPFFNLAAVLLAVIVSGCGKKPQSRASGNSATNYPLPDPPVVVACEPGIPGGRLIVDEVGDPKTFNMITADEGSSVGIGRFLFWRLLNYDAASQQVLPGLAQSWTNSADGKTWTLTLRKNLRWSDGQPLTADDVVFTWNDVIYNPKIVNPTRDTFIVEGKNFTVTKLDDLTVQVVTPEVFAPFLMEFGTTFIMPKHILARSVADGTFASAYGVNARPEDIVGSGPFRLKEYKAGQYTLLERNPYFLEVDKKGQRLPYFDNIIFAVVPDLNAMSLRFLSGESDVDEVVDAFEYDRFKTESLKGKFDLLEPGVGLEINYFFFNENTNVNGTTGKPYVDPKKLKWFRNKNFRQACSYAIDREAIIRSVYSGRAIPQYGYVTPGDKRWFNPNTRPYPHDPAKALALLKEMGIEKRNGDDVLTDAEGNKIEFVLNVRIGYEAREKAAMLIASDFGNIGIHIILQPLEFNTLISKLDETRDYDCILMMYSFNFPDPAESMTVIKSGGFDTPWFPRQKMPSTGWEARLDYLMDAQMKTLDYVERKKDFDEVQEILAEQQPLIFTVTPMYYAAIRPDIGNVRATALSYYRATWNGEELYFKKSPATHK
jgi:peptide/nickel transport system substrate-binding protein